ncbi:hypothetical protein GQ651_01320 [Alphaproteobacteria bacterium GH1-50]|uniref:Ceramidase n=1 Tax=Kangsaoukella pontilimi TaxID=2691042 RepID=A0A7C9MY25_9RHOB|nr:ceramidase domain-containing protein [Kangsaoukella pontilimi]MXQ06478.1 hypothetical protein [Kangsaoukella pontilimi]
MDWTRAFDNYCERTDLTYWSEPLNALTNIAFLVAAVVMWRRTGGLRDGRILSAILFAIGIGSWLFHTHATVWAVTLDVIPIILFSLFYIFLANRDFWGWPVPAAILGAALYIPFSAAANQVFDALPFFRISSGYWPLPLIIFFYAGLLATRDRRLGGNLALGASILCVSLTFRSVDEMFCETTRIGTHFVWHCLNAVMLGWMIETWRRQRLAARAR